MKTLAQIAAELQNTLPKGVREIPEDDAATLALALIDLGTGKAVTLTNGSLPVGTLTETIAASQAAITVTGLTRIRLTASTSGLVVNSLTGAADGQIVRLINPGSNSITVKQNTGGTAGYRFRLKSAADATLAQYGVLTLVYDAGLACWLEVSRNF